MKRIEKQALDGTVITELVPESPEEEREIERMIAEGEIEGEQFEENLHPEVDLDADDDG